MIVSSPTAPEAAADEVVDTLLLVTAGDTKGAAEASAELIRRLSEDGRVDAQIFPLGDDAHSSLATVMARSTERIVAVPLSASSHDDLPARVDALLRWARAWWPAVAFLQTAPLGTVGYAVDWASRRIRATLDTQVVKVPRGRTGVLVVGPAGGTPLANAEICAIARLLWEDGNYGLVETAFVYDGGRPSVTDRMASFEQAGMLRLVVLPLVMLDGPMLTAVHSLVAQYPSPDGRMDIVVAGPLLDTGAAAAIVRERYHEARLHRQPSGDVETSAGHEHAPLAADGARRVENILPPRYQGGAVASSTPMRSAPLNYDADGQVAWDTIWQSFCDLALAGGPPHRGTLLEPASKEDVLQNREDYVRVAAEIARGLSMITGFPVIADAAPGWVGLVCPDEPMAVWMLRAIIVENVSVRRQGATLFLPAGPDYRIEKEIKNVITAVAKTHHYFTEHLNAR